MLKSYCLQHEPIWCIHLTWVSPVASWSDQYYLQKTLTRLGRWHYIVTVTLHNSTSHLQYSYPEYGARKLFYCIIAKYIWGIAVQSLRDGQLCGNLPYYGKPTEMVYSSQNGMIINCANQGMPSSSWMKLKYDMHVLSKTRISDFKLPSYETVVKTCHKVRTKTSKTYTSFLKYHKLRFVAFIQVTELMIEMYSSFMIIAQRVTHKLKYVLVYIYQ